MMIINRTIIELAEDLGLQWEVAVVQAEAGADQDRIHVGFMQGNTTGTIVGTMQIVPTTGPTGRQEEAAEAANKTGVEAEALDAITITIMEVEITINRITTTIQISIKISNKVITMNNIGNKQCLTQACQLSQMKVKIRPEGLRHQSMQGTCISTISYQMRTAVHGALGTTILWISMVGGIEMRRRLLQ